jgi:hypothetical protein
MDDRPIDVNAKKHVRAKNKILRKERRKEDREARRREIRCFWTRPFGHAWEDEKPTGFHKTCAGCDTITWRI